ncbi:hypothetical protein MMC30_008952 [Trapelia coarctata]|nr:hypothetical protein [Trapelia coarctata]
MLTGEEFDYHCHSNLTRAVLPFGLAESDVHDVLNVFQVTGLDREGRYFMHVSTSPPLLDIGHLLLFLSPGGFSFISSPPDWLDPVHLVHHRPAQGVEDGDAYVDVHRQPSPAKPGDFFEFFAEIDMLCALSTCPGGDLSAWEFGESEGEGKGKVDMLDTCRPLGVEVFEIVEKTILEGWRSPECPGYRGVHGLGMPVFGKGGEGVAG